MSKAAFFSLFIIGLLATSLLANNPANGQDIKEVVITVEYSNATLSSVFNDIEAKTEFTFLYHQPPVEFSSKRINIERTRESVAKILKQIMAQTGLGFYQINNTIAVKYPGEENLVSEIPPETGSISGTVKNGNGEPIPTANVLLLEASRGAATNLEGEYTIENVEEGTYTLRVTFIGYEMYKEQITVTAGQNTVHNVVLQNQVTELQELVVTGAGVVTEKKRLGQSVGIVGSDQLQDAPVSTVSEALQGRIPGLVANSIGEVGASAPIRIRGTVSLTQRNGPLIYIDGVRVNNDRQGFASISTSPLSQINPENIARIEVLKGAAAATLFGTEASSGVIQIFTKKGINKPMRWTFKTVQGFSQTPLGRIPPNEVYDSNTDKILSNSPAGHYIEPGYSQKYNLSVKGGSDTFGYYASGWYGNVDGSLPTNAVKNLGVRVNMTMRPLEGMQVRLGLNLINSKIRAPYPTWGLMGEFVLADPRIAGPGQPFGELYHSIPGVLAYKNLQNSRRSTLSGEVNYQFSDNLGVHFLVGYNEGNQRTLISVPPGPDQSNPKGWRSVTNGRHSETTAEGSLTWNSQPASFLSSTLVLGAQSFWQKDRSTNAAVKNYPGIAVKTLRGGTVITDLDEFFKEIISAGIFVQEQLGINDRLFFTGGIRVDGNSTFGSSFGFQPYPRVGMSWVLSDAPFWNFGLFDLFRLRAAYGTSGLQPGVYDALQTWRIESLLGGLPVLLPESFGNEDLKPERSREIEFGVNMEFLDNKLGIDLTYYWQRTSDAILARLRAPSNGFLNPQLVNIGELQSRGLEASLNLVAVNNANFRWEIFSTLATRHQTVTDLGGIPGFKTGGDSRRWNFIKEGYQPGAVIGPVLDPNDPYHLTVAVEDLTSLDQIVPNFLMGTDGERETRFLGNQLPTITGSFGMTFNLPNSGLSLSTLLRAEGGFVMHNETRQVRVGNRITPMTARMIRDLQDPATSTARRQEIAAKYARNHPEVVQDWISDGDYIRLQKVSLSWEVPTKIATMLSMQSATVTLAGRNLLLISGYEGIIDPGTTSSGGDFGANIDYFAAPNPRQFEMSIRITF